MIFILLALFVIFLVYYIISSELVWCKNDDGDSMLLIIMYTMIVGGITFFSILNGASKLWIIPYLIPLLAAALTIFIESKKNKAKKKQNKELDKFLASQCIEKWNKSYPSRFYSKKYTAIVSAVEYYYYNRHFNNFTSLDEVIDALIEVPMLKADGEVYEALHSYKTAQSKATKIME